MPSVVSEPAQKIIRWIILGLSILAWIFVIVMVAHCSFLFNDDVGFTEVGLGLFSGQVDGDSCENYESNDAFDGAFKAGRAFGTLAALATSFAMVLVISIQLFISTNNENLKRALWLSVVGLYGVSFLCHLLTFSAFASDLCDAIDCGVGAASGIGIFNIFVILALCILTNLVGPPDKPAIVCDCSSTNDEETPATPTKGTRQDEKTPPNSPETPVTRESTKVTIVEKPDGSKVTTKEVTHADGSKTITETTEIVEQ